MIIAGIDYSLTCPAICIHDTRWGAFSYHNTCNYFRSNLKRFEQFNENRLCAENHSPWKTEEDRYDDIAANISKVDDSLKKSHKNFSKYKKIILETND